MTAGPGSQGSQPAADWLVPDWPLPPGIQALCSTRSGGVSLPPYDSLNLGMHVGDDPAAVQANRLRLQARMQQAAAAGPAVRPVFLNQVHGEGVVQLDAATPDGTEADACLSTEPGVACTVMVADCLPVLLAHRSGAVVAAAHAGWRGLAGRDGRHGVLEAVFERFQALVKDPPGPVAIEREANEDSAAQTLARSMLAWLGPCIGPSAFEVGAEVRAAFCAANPGLQTCFTPSPGAPGKYLCDLAALARRRLQALGITALYGNDSTPPWCTVTNASRFFSHRRDSVARGGSGRFAASIWRNG